MFQKGEPFFEAILTGNTEEVKRLIDNGLADVNDKNAQGRTPLMLASMVDGSSKEMLGILICRGAGLDAQDNCRDTALVYALERGRLDNASKLIDKGASLTLDYMYGDSLMTTMVKAGSDNERKAMAIEMLADRGADPNRSGKGMCTPLQQAASQGFVDVVRMLLDKGAALDVVTDNDSQTPLEAATIKYNMNPTASNLKEITNMLTPEYLRTRIEETLRSGCAFLSDRKYIYDGQKHATIINDCAKNANSEELSRILGALNNSFCTNKLNAELGPLKEGFFNTIGSIQRSNDGLASAVGPMENIFNCARPSLVYGLPYKVANAIGTYKKELARAKSLTLANDTHRNKATVMEPTI